MAQAKSQHVSCVCATGRNCSTQLFILQQNSNDRYVQVDYINLNILTNNPHPPLRYMASFVMYLLGSLCMMVILYPLVVWSTKNSKRAIRVLAVLYIGQAVAFLYLDYRFNLHLFIE